MRKKQPESSYPEIAIGAAISVLLGEALPPKPVTVEDGVYAKTE